MLYVVHATAKLWLPRRIDGLWYIVRSFPVRLRVCIACHTYVLYLDTMVLVPATQPLELRVTGQPIPILAFDYLRSPVRLRAWVLWGLREASPTFMVAELCSCPYTHVFVLDTMGFHGSGAVLRSITHSHGLRHMVSDTRSRTHGLGPWPPG